MSYRVDDDLNTLEYLDVTVFAILDRLNYRYIAYIADAFKPKIPLNAG